MAGRGRWQVERLRGKKAFGQSQMVAKGTQGVPSTPERAVSSQAHLLQGRAGYRSWSNSHAFFTGQKKPLSGDCPVGTHRWKQGIDAKSHAQPALRDPQGRPEGLPPDGLLWPRPFAPGLCLLLQGAHSRRRKGRAAGRVRALTQQPWGTGVHDAILGRLEDGLGQGDGVPHHGPVQPVLRHDAAPAPALLPLSPFGSAILEPDLQV